MLSRFCFGRVAEYFVMFIYMCRFYKILAYRCSKYGGEIDLILSKKNLLVFVEVKARQNFDFYDYNKNIVSYIQKSRIKRAAQMFIFKNNKKYSNYDVRFDLVLVRPYRYPCFLENAW